MEEIAVLEDLTEDLTITVTITLEELIAEDITHTTQAPEIFITEHLQAGTHLKLGDTPLERGNRTCRFGYI